MLGPTQEPNLATDEILALGLQQGRTEEMATLVERHYDALVGYLYRLTGGRRELAADLAQETFLRVLSKAHQYRYPRPFKPWLYAIATNLARNHYRRAETRRTRPAGERVLATEPGSPPEETIITDDESRRVVALLAALPAGQREAVILRYYQELSLAEIAATLGVPVGTVKSRLSLGLHRLRVLLEQEDGCPSVEQ